MATSAKTVEYRFPVLASLTDNSLTALTGITVDLPEASKVFKSVIAEVYADDLITATGGTVASRQVQISVNGAGATNITNTATITHSAENISLYYNGDFAAHFNTNYTGTSHSVACSVLIDQSTGTTLGWANVFVKLIITYEYDTTSTTQVKTVRYPLNAPVGAMATSKPGTATAVIPNIDTLLPESSKTYKQIHLVIEGGVGEGSGTTDFTLNTQVDTLTAITVSWEQGLGTDRNFYMHGNWTGHFTTNATHNFYVWGSITNKLHHVQAYMVITYTYDEDASTSIYNSVMVPFSTDSFIGYNTSSDYTSLFAKFYITEPGTIVTVAEAAFLSFNRVSAATGLEMRLGTGSFVAYTDGGSTIGGSGMAMIRNDSALTLARGKNEINIDMFCTITTSPVGCIGGYVLFCYTSDKASQGSYAHNKTIQYGLIPMNTRGIGSNVEPEIISTTPFIIPEAEYFISGMSHYIHFIPTSTLTGTQMIFDIERLTSDPEGRHGFKSTNVNLIRLDGEVGHFHFIPKTSELFERYPGDLDICRMYHDATREYRLLHVNLQGITCVQQWITYHSFSFEIQGTITNSAGGTVYLSLHDALTDEVLLRTSRSGNGAYTFTWFDVREVYVVAYESDTKKGRSLTASGEVAAYSEIDLDYDSVDSLVEGSPGEWEATADSGYDIDYPNVGVDTVNTLPAATDGWIQARYDSSTLPHAGIAFKNAVTLNEWTDIGTGIAGVRIIDDSGNKKLQCLDPNVSDTTIADILAPNDLYRIIRESGTFYCDLSTDDGATWDRKHTFIITDNTEVWAFGYTAGGAGAMNVLYDPKLFLPGATATQFDIDLEPTGGGGGTRVYTG